jgi:outer membrane protein assembly factor BamA
MSKIAVAGLMTALGLTCRKIYVLAMAFTFAAPNLLFGQVSDAVNWRQTVNGEVEEWPIELPRPQSDVNDEVGRLLAWYHQRGFYEAVVDSVRSDSIETMAWVAPGEQVTVGIVILTGVTSFLPEQLAGNLETRSGEILDSDALERDIDGILAKYEAAGFVLASARIVRVGPSEQEPRKLEIAVHVDEGPLLELGAIEIVGGGRTKPSFISRATGMKIGKPLTGFDTDEIRARLEVTGLFSAVDSVRLAVDENQRAVMRVAIAENPPGAFDALVGYLPNAGSTGGGSVVGDVNILLRHVLGGGRSFGFRFSRSPGSITRANIEAEDPFIFGLPFRLSGRFNGFQQDSTFDTRSFGFEGGYRIQRLEFFASSSWELARPGSATLSTVPISDSWFAGVGFSYRHLDRAGSPRKGIELESNVENGRKTRETTRESPNGGSERVLETAFQQRLQASGRIYMSAMQRHIAVIGVDTRAIQSRTYDEADLIRFGGANSMRGYNEDQYRGNLTARFLSEWRFLLDPYSFLFSFVDLGYVNLPEINTSTPAERVADEWLVGYGVGLQLHTQAGLFVMSLAFNGDEGLQAKVHIGMTLGL